MTVDLELAYASAARQAELVASKQVSPRELVDQALARIDQVQPSLNCFTSVWADEARALADAAGDAVARGDELGLLHGVPVALKETTHVLGKPLTLGSLSHRDVVADRDAHVTTALRRAGAIVIGQTTSPEFAHTLQTDSPMWGVTRNPWNPAYTPGGSSGGSGVAVATGCVALAEGSDMGGSVRIPAAWCGIVGLKPGLGRIPMDVLPGLFDSISHHGPLARSVDDARRFLAVTQGPSDADIMSVTTPLDLAGATPSDVRGMRLGLSIDFTTWYVHPEIEAAVQARGRCAGRCGCDRRAGRPAADQRRRDAVGAPVGCVHVGLLRPSGRRVRRRDGPRRGAPDRARRLAERHRVQATRDRPHRRVAASVGRCSPATMRCCARRWRCRR